MKYRMNVYPALENSMSGITFTFDTVEQMMVAKECCANLLLFVQDKLKVMKGYSNMFELEEFIDGEWQEYEYFE